MPSKHKKASSGNPPVGESAAANDKKMSDPKSNPDGKGHANPPRAPSPPADKQWREHEHHVSAAPGQAKEVAKETGSPELAKHVDKQAKEDVTVPPQHAAVLVSDSDKDSAARQVGFESFAALVEHSASLEGVRNRVLFVCELHDGRWIRFERESWPKFEAFQSRDEAMPQQTS